jgi:hypothetical protein
MRALFPFVADEETLKARQSELGFVALHKFLQKWVIALGCEKALRNIRSMAGDVQSLF